MMTWIREPMHRSMSSSGRMGRRGTGEKVARSDRSASAASPLDMLVLNHKHLSLTQRQNLGRHLSRFES